MIVSYVVMSLAATQAAKKPAPGPVAPKIKIELLAPGSGPSSVKGDVVSFDYIGRLANGHVFNNSMAVKGDPSHPARAPLAVVLGEGEAIPGLDQALLGKKVGEKFQVTIPPALAYEGNGTADGSVPPNATISFDITVLNVLNAHAKPVDTIQDIKVGTGPAVKPQDTVTLQYVGTFLNGVKFDSTRDRNQPFSFQVGVGRVVPGFDQGVIGMKKGGLRKVTIPPMLAYGRPPFQSIPGNSTLVFELELLDVKPAPAKSGG